MELQWPGPGMMEIANAALVALVTIIGVRLARSWVTAATRRARVDTGTQILVRRTLTIGIVVLGGLGVLSILGVPPATLLAVIGAVSLALSLSVQDILKNFFSGVYLLLERPFRVGDIIKVKDQQGVVENIGVRTTTLRTPENIQVLVPNALVFAEVVTNHSQVRTEAPAVAVAEEPATPATSEARSDSASGPQPQR